jgi:hypothetical protein
MDREISAKARASSTPEASSLRRLFPHERPKWKATDADLRMFERIAKGEEPVNVTLAAPTFRNESRFFGAAG